MYQLHQEDNTTWITEENDHYYAMVTMNLIDKRHPNSRPVRTAMYIEIDKDDPDAARDKAKKAATHLGYYFSGEIALDISRVNVDAGKFYLHGKRNE